MYLVFLFFRFGKPRRQAGRDVAVPQGRANLGKNKIYISERTIFKNKFHFGTLLAITLVRKLHS